MGHERGMRRGAGGDGSRTGHGLAWPYQEFMIKEAFETIHDQGGCSLAEGRGHRKKKKESKPASKQQVGRNQTMASMCRDNNEALLMKLLDRHGGS